MPRKSKKSVKALETEAIPQTETVAAEAAAEAPAPAPTGIEDPIGDTTDGEAQVYLGDEAESVANAESGSEAAEALPEEPAADAAIENEEAAEKTAGEAESPAEAQPAAKLERLQKILSQAGIASRRRAEELITEGRVQVNGTVVTTLGTKADPEHDHIRVDGKLLHGAERLRYFALNKPKGFVTTVSDPEGRPTVMQFFAKMRERLYPVGRLDYQSEGLLLMTNDGDLANRLTRAGSGVEKTYLVKVAGQPTEEQLELLRGGVAIERGQPGSKKVHTAPAHIRQVRQGDNPWYEVVLIEGRNRELRKMFSAIGHFVEKIRRVGYGPLVLDVEPGTLRELEPEEVAALRLAAEGKRATGKVWARQRDAAQYLDEAAAAILPPRPTRARTAKPAAGKRFEPREAQGEFRPKRTFGKGKPRFDSRPREGRPDSKAFRRDEPRKFGRTSREERGFDRRSSRPQEGETRNFKSKPGRDKFGASDRPGFKRRFERPRFERQEGNEEREARPRSSKPRFQGPKTEGRFIDREKRFGGREKRSGFGQGERPRPDRTKPPRAEGGFKRSFKTGGPSKARGAKPGGRPGRFQRKPGGGFGKKRG